MPKTPQSQSVLIVGASPTGFTAAIELVRRGYRPRIVDKDSGPAAESRALGVNPRTLHVLEPCGATERLIAAGNSAKFLNFHTAERDLFRLRLAELGGPFPYMLVLPQSDTEKVLEQVLGDLGVDVDGVRS